jgi:hypothetical protein
MDVTNLDIAVNDSQADDLSASVRSPIKVQGSFRLLNTEQHPPPLIVQVTQNRNGTKVIYNSVGIQPEKKAGTVSFSAEIGAPPEPGEFQVEVLGPEQELFVRRIRIIR